MRALKFKGQKGRSSSKEYLIPSLAYCKAWRWRLRIRDTSSSCLTRAYITRTSRDLFKGGLEATSGGVLSSHAKVWSVPGQEVWRAHILRLHSLCLSDADRNDEALQAAANAHELCKDAFPELARQMTKLKSLAAISGNKDAGDGVQGALALTQYVRSGGCKDAEEAESTLKDAWSKVDSASELCGRLLINHQRAWIWRQWQR